jgi:hypothetical protein
MSSSGQQPPIEENGEQAADTMDNTNNTDNTNNAANPEVVPEMGSDAATIAESVHQGLIYPPPPSYYENMSLPSQAAQPPLPSQAVRKETSPLAPQATGGFVPSTQGPGPVYRPPQEQWGMPATPSYPPPWGPQPPLQSMQPMQPSQKRSRKWIWLVVSVLGVALLASCGLCSWGVYALVNTVYQPVVGSITVADDFYSNLQNQDYAAAYADLAPQGLITGLTLNQFTQQAMQADTQYGPVTSYMPGQPGFNSTSNGPDLSIVTLPVSITRTHSTYGSLLTLQQEGGKWKIIDYDRI